MKGYFGQLARRTGLSIGNNAGAQGGRVSTEPGVAGGPKASAPVAPIHVEEVVFTASSPAVDSGVSTNKTSGTTVVSEDKNHAASAVTPNEVFASPQETVSPAADLSRNATGDQSKASRHTGDVPETSLFHETPPEARVRLVPPQSEIATPTTEHVFFDERPFDQSRTVTAEHQPLTEAVTVESSVTELRQPHDGTRDSSVSHHEVQHVEIVNTIESPKPANTNVAGAPEREPRRIFQDQLKEVIAWITSPPEEVEQTTFEVVEAQHDTSTVVVREREQQRPVDRPTTNNEPHVNDLSLSIGTISIVVEEPKQDFPVPLTPAPTTHTSPQPVAPEPTRLSRYYLRNL